MGLEIINNPQVFTQGITALGGIQGATEKYPLLTSYYSWTTSTNVNTDTLPIPLALGYMLGDSESFIVSVGGVLQPPSTYSIDVNNRLLVFSTPVSADIEIAVTQLATASPSSQSFDFIKSLSASITTLSCLSARIEDLTVGSSFEPPNLYLPAPGELGIGLDSVDTLTRFHIKAPENDQIMITNNTTPTSSWKINVSDSNGSFYLFDFDQNRTPFRIIKNTPTNTLYLNTVGVGINTASPNRALTVVGDISATNTVECSSVNTVSLTGARAYFTGTNVGIGTNVPITIFETRGGTSTFTSSGNERSIAARYNATGSSVYFGASNDTATPNAVISNTSSTAIATFAHGGSVGIGTTTPNANFRLTVADGKGSGSSNFNTQFTSGNYWLGVNTRSDAGSWNPLVQNNDTSVIFTQGTVDTGGLVIAQHSNSTRGIRIAPTGNVGVGTATPRTTLDVAGNLTVTGLVSSPFIDSYLALNSDGNNFYRPGTGVFLTTSPFELSAITPSLAISLDGNSVYEVEYGIHYRIKHISTTLNTANHLVFALSATDTFPSLFFTGQNVYSQVHTAVVSTPVWALSAAANSPQGGNTFIGGRNVVEFDETAALTIPAPGINDGRNGKFTVTGTITTTDPITLTLASKIRSTTAGAAVIQPLRSSYRKVKKLTTV